MATDYYYDDPGITDGSEESPEDDYDDYDTDTGAANNGLGSPGFTEMKEQMYRDKLADLKRQLQQLNEGNLPEYTKKLRKLENVYRWEIR